MEVVGLSEWTLFSFPFSGFVTWWGALCFVLIYRSIICRSFLGGFSGCEMSISRLAWKVKIISNPTSSIALETELSIWIATSNQFDLFRPPCSGAPASPKDFRERLVVEWGAYRGERSKFVAPSPFCCWTHSCVGGHRNIWDGCRCIMASLV